MEQNDVSRYLDDVVLIKRTLQEKEGEILLSPWIFYVWAAVITGATLISRLAAWPAGWAAVDIAWKIWLPAIFLGGLFESAGWIQYFLRENRVVWTEGIQKLLLLFPGVIAALAVINLGLLERGVEVDGVVLLSTAVCLMVYAGFSRKSLMAEGYFLLVFGAVVMIIGWTSPAGYTASGLVCGAVFLAAGIHPRILQAGQGSPEPFSPEGG